MEFAQRRNWVIVDVFHLCRPAEWVKNLFVLAPLLFSPPQWTASGVSRAALATIAFCFWSSSLYCVNDALDAKADSQHPMKRNRPLASGRISTGVALAASVMLILIANAIGAILISWSFLFYGMLYLGNGFTYCLLLKHRVIIDVISIAIGFVLRLMAGCSAIDVVPSSWLLLCGFSLAMMLGFGKRRLEIGAAENATAYRATLISYDIPKLNMLLSVTCSICLMAYILYVVAPQTVALHHTDRLIITVPFVVYGIFRYTFKVQEGRHSGPLGVLAGDPIFALNGLLWLATVILVLYISHG